MQYLLTFVGKISWEGRQNDLPEEIYAFLIYDENGAPAETTTPNINKLIEDQMVAFLKAQGMFVQRDQGQVIDLRVTPQDRMYVPFRWVVHLRVTLKPLAVELSNPDEHGVERMKDGSVPTKH